MNWFQNKSLANRKIAKDIEQQKRYGVEGNYKRRYTFVFEQKHFITPGYSAQHKITGVFDCGLLKVEAMSGAQRWSIEMRNIEFDWNYKAIPEYYFMYAFPYRMDIDIDSSGNLIKCDTWINFVEEWRKRYKRSVFEQIKDENRAHDFYRMMCSWGKREALTLLKFNPLISAIGAIVSLNYNLNKTPCEPKGEFGELFTSELLIRDYFHEGIHLPLKTTWLQQEMEDDSEERWIRLGGLIQNKYKEEEFKRIMRKVTDCFNLEVPMYVEHSELYQIDKVRADFRQIKYAEMNTKSLIKDTWIKSENLELVLDEKGVVYG